MKKYVVIAIDVGETCNGHSTFCGMFDTKEAAEKYVKEDEGVIEPLPEHLREWLDNYPEEVGDEEEQPIAVEQEISFEDV